MRTEETVASYIARHNLLDKAGRHIIALSGGADSVALLLILSGLGYDVEAAHCNFHLRGEESDRDEDFVKSLCQSRAVPLHLVHFDTVGYASLHKVSIEMAARQLRYNYFEQLRRDIGAADICVAHHRDDSVETVLMNLVRGTGLRGLTGIRPVNGHIKRPLLCLSRQDIECYLASVGQPYVTDSTNLVDDVVRNKLRLNVIPLLKEINPAFSENVSRAAAHVTDAVTMLDAATVEAIKKVVKDYDGGAAVDINKLKSEPSPAYLLYEILRQYGFCPAQTEQIHANLDAPSGRVFSSQSHELLIDRGRLLIERNIPAIQPQKIIEDGTYVLKSGGRLKVSMQPIDNSFVLSRSSDTACLDADKIAFPLTLRPAAEGDRFVPFGMKGTKLVSDYLTDRKYSLFRKRRQLVLTDASGRIVWLVGERPDNRFRITEESRRALVMTIKS